MITSPIRSQSGTITKSGFRALLHYLLVTLGLTMCLLQPPNNRKLLHPLPAPPVPAMMTPPSTSTGHPLPNQPFFTHQDYRHVQPIQCLLPPWNKMPSQMHLTRLIKTTIFAIAIRITLTLLSKGLLLDSRFKATSQSHYRYPGILCLTCDQLRVFQHWILSPTHHCLPAKPQLQGVNLSSPCWVLPRHLLKRKQSFTLLSLVNERAFL